MSFTYKKILLSRRPRGMPEADDFKLVEQALPSLQEGQVLIKNQFISIDPAMRGWMNEGTTYIKGVEIGEVMRAFAAGTVVESKNEGFAAGDHVQGLLGVEEFSVSNGQEITKVNTSIAPLSWHLGLLGMPGLTAYFGLLEKGQPKPGDTVLVSGAAGMIGSLVGQIAKMKGCKVIGIAGGKEKCNYIKNELGFDGAIDYKTENVAKAIHQLAPSGVDIYFDNVGGEILDAALLNLAKRARVVICGAISQYNDANFNGLKNYMKIVTARGTLTGIIVLDYFSRAHEAVSEISEWMKEGKIKYREHVVHGIENFANALQMLFKGENRGKLILATSNA